VFFALVPVYRRASVVLPVYDTRNLWIRLGEPGACACMKKSLRFRDQGVHREFPWRNYMISPTRGGAGTLSPTLPLHYLDRAKKQSVMTSIGREVRSHYGSA